MATPVDATHNITTASSGLEVDVWENADIGSYRVSAYTDLNALIAASEGGVVTLRLYNKVDEANYREVLKQTFQVGTDTTHPVSHARMVHHNTKLTVETSSGVTATRAVPYRYITEDLDA